ncbi:MAG TPA: XdhC family protein [Chloroflexota bacterium]|nr:XdhC family protein [Chloroflexota bacterium]
MKDILDDLDRWRSAGEKIALVTVVKTAGSTPRPRGAKMAITASGKIAGSVSGGCLESNIYEEAMSVLESGRPKLLHYGISDEMAFDVGLSCGGEVDVFVEPLDW